MATKKPTPKGPVKKKPVEEGEKLQRVVSPAPEAAILEPDEPPVEPDAPHGTLPFEVDPARVEASLNRLRDQLIVWAKKGRYTKVRFKFRGKQLLPDIPLAAVVAVEGATFYWTGLLRALVFNFAGRTLIDVELVNDSEKRIQKGKEFLLSGDLDDALEAFEEALDMDPTNPHVHLNLGVALKLKGDHEAARAALHRAKDLAGKGPVATEADRLLRTLKPRPGGLARA